MHFEKIIFFIFILSINCLVCTAFAESSVWKVSQGDNYFYLGGTIHVLQADDHPLPDEFAAAYQDSSEIIFETDKAATETVEFQTKMITAMTYSDNRTLESELEPGVYQELVDFLALRQIPVETFAKFQPWGVCLTIAVLEYQLLGMVPEYGVDAYFYNLSVLDGKEIVSLETPDEQLAFLATMSAVDPNANVSYTVRDLDRLPEIIETMKQSWRSGDLDSFANSSYVLEMKTEFPQVYKILLTDRNNNWMQVLPSLVDDENVEFVLVGMMHLIGDDGLLNQLSNQGFELEQL